LSENERIINECKDDLDDLETSVQNANENGLFKEDYDSYKKIVESISAAFNDLSATPPKLVDAREKYSLACYNLNKACDLESFWWRFKYFYGGPALVYLIGLFGFYLFLWFQFQPLILNSNVLWIPTWSFFWGSLGGILYGFWWLWQHCSQRKFRKPWYIWYALLPIMGAILGALAYLIFVAGFVAATGTSAIQSQEFIMLLSALSGFSARWAVKMLESVANMIKVG